MTTTSDDASADGVLLIGAGQLADAAARALEEAGGATVHRLEDPDDREIREALDDRVGRVVVISRFDHLSLRRALVVAHVRPDLPALVTIFDRDVATHLQDTVENVRVLSMADVVAPTFAGPLLDPRLVSLVADSTRPARGVVATNGRPQQVQRTWSAPSRVRRVFANVEALVRPFDSGARILVYGLFGFLAVLVVEALVTMLATGLSLVDAAYTVTKVVVTVGPSSAADQGPAWFKLFSIVAILLAFGSAAVLTAGIVNRLLDRRLTGIVGRSAVPRRNHVVVVGLGQVGLCLCGLLRDLGVPVVAVELNPDAKTVARAKAERLPIVIGNGSSQRLLAQLSIRRARALAAVTSDEGENIVVAVAARGLRADLNIALRADEGDATSEILSLFRVGVVRDVYRIAGTALAAAALGSEVREAFPHEGTMYLIDEAGKIEPFITDVGVDPPPQRTGTST